VKFGDKDIRESGDLPNKTAGSPNIQLTPPDAIYLIFGNTQATKEKKDQSTQDFLENQSFLNTSLLIDFFE
jgi:hypothetical protein